MSDLNFPSAHEYTSCFALISLYFVKVNLPQINMIVTVYSQVVKKWYLNLSYYSINRTESKFI